MRPFAWLLDARRVALLARSRSGLQRREFTELCQPPALVLEELIRAVAAGNSDGLSDTVVAMLQSRLSLLEPESRQLLRAASVFGETFWLGGLRLLLGMRYPAAEVAQRLGRLVAEEVIERRRDSRFSGEEEYVFRHGLMRDACYGLLTDADREGGHRAALSYLEARGEGDADPLVLAEHARRGGELARAVPLYARAAMHAYVHNDFAACDRLAEQGVSCGASGPCLGELRALQATMLFWRGQHTEAIRTGYEAIALLPAGGAEWCLAASYVITTAGISMRLGSELPLVETCLTVEPAPDAIAGYARVLCMIVHMAVAVGFVPIGRRSLARLERLAPNPELADPLTRASLHFARGWMSLMCGQDCFESSLHYEQSLAAYHEMGDARHGLHARMHQARAQAVCGMVNEATAALESYLEQANKLWEPLLASVIQSRLGEALCRRALPEDLARAEALSRALWEDASRLDLYRGFAVANLAQVALRKGRYEDAVQHARDALFQLRGGRSELPMPLSTLIRALVALGKTEQALEHAAELTEMLCGTGFRGHSELSALLALYEAQKQAGRTAAAQALLSEAHEKLYARQQRLPESLRTRFFSEVADHETLRRLAERELAPGT